MDAEAPYVSFLAEGGRGVPLVSGLVPGDLNVVLPPCVCATLAACS
jgi:hypothetical protein